MAKTIKFNLILDNFPVRDLEGLREHFSIEDMLEYFDNGLLIRWLNIRGYNEQLDAVKSINKSAGKKEIITALVKIFGIDEIYEDDIQKTVNALEYMETKRHKDEAYKNNSFEKEKIVLDYHNGYESIIEKMEENKDDFAFLKQQAHILFWDYYRLFELDYKNLYFRLVDSAPKAIYAIVTIDEFRKIWLKSSRITEDMNHRLLSPDDLKKHMKGDFKTVCKNTGTEWELIESSSKEVIILNCERACYYRGTDDTTVHAWSDNEKLIKLKGLEFKSSSTYYKLYYMEA